MTIDILNADMKKYATPRQCEYIDAVLKYGSDTKAAAAMGVNRRTVDRAISAAKRAAIEAGGIITHGNAPRVLVLDIETAPVLAYIWRMFDEVRGIDQIEMDWYILSWSAKWLGSKEVMGRSLFDTEGYYVGTEDDRSLLEDLHKLLNDADYVITHNGDRFDIKKMYARFLERGFAPVTPYKSIDTLKIAKRVFGFTSNKLDFLSRKLLGKSKIQHDGLELWKRCLAGHRESWHHMLKYNKKDVLLLEEVYMKMRPWDHLHPSFAVHTDKDSLLCTVCGSDKVEPTGKTVKTATGAYLGYVCKPCGHQMRGRTNVRTLAQSHATLMNAK